jgi:hypothetical protein
MACYRNSFTSLLYVRKNKLEKIQKEDAVNYFEALYWKLPAVTENQRKISVKILRVPAVNRTQHLSNTCRERYRLT